MAVLSLYALYLVGLNVFLSTSLFERAFAGAREDVRVAFRRGWSVWPGTVHARDLDVQGQDSHVEWLLHLDEVSFDIDFAALARRRFALGRVDGTGISFRLRTTRDARPVTNDELVDLPPLPGRPPYTVAPAGPPSLETWDDAHYHLWTVALERIHARAVRELWLDDVRFTGSADIEGRFLLRPIRAFEVGPATVRIDRGAVRLGRGTPLLASVAGTASLTLERTDPRTLAGGAIFRSVSATADLAAESADLAGLPGRLPHELAAQGTLGLALRGLAVERGVLARGALTADADALGLGNDRVRGGAGLHATAQIADAALDLTATLREVTVAAGAGAPLARAPHIELGARASRLDLAADPLADLAGTLDAPAIAVDDTRRLAALLPAETAIAPGPGALAARVHLDLDRAAGTVGGAAHVAGTTALAVGETRLAGTLAVDVSAPPLSVDGPLHDVTLHAEGAGVRAAVGELALGADTLAVDARSLHLAGRALGGLVEARARGLALGAARGKLTGEAELRADVRGFAPAAGTLALGPSRLALTHVRGRLAGAARDDLEAGRVLVEGSVARLALDAGTARGIDAKLVLERITLADARSLDRLLPVDSGLRIEGGAARIDGTLRLRGEARQAAGLVHVSVADGAIAIGETHLRGSFAGDVRARGYDPERQTFDLAGSRLAMTDVVLAGAADRRPWRGAVVAKAATLRLGPEGPELASTVWLEADDARPVLGVLLDGAVPKLLAGLVTMPRLRGRAEVEIAPRRLRISAVEAAGGDVALRGGFGLYDRVRHGAFVVEKGPVSVGLRLDPEGIHPRFFGLDRWITNEAREDAARAAKKAPASE